MSQKPDFMTRRRFLRTGVLGGALAGTLPSFLDHTLRHIEAAEQGTGVQRPHGGDAPILVLMQLAGGNDGLNTVIPLGNDHYAKARPVLGRVAADALRLDQAFGLHPALSGMKWCYDEGLLGIIHGVGYPNPNRSHFRSTEIWHTGMPEDSKATQGWIGRYFDANCQGQPPETGISLTQSTPQAFLGNHSLGITFTDPGRFRFDGEPVMMGDEAATSSGSSVEQGLGGGVLNPVDPLAFLERTSLDAHVSSEQLHAVLRKHPAPAGFPNTRLGRDLALVARLIGGGMATRVYYVSQGGFDTHVNQANTHQRLLTEFGDALKAFWSLLQKQGNQRRVQMLVFSEFGRRVKENGSQGTDHGAAGPVYLFGGGVKAGLHGEMPSLAPDDLVRGDLRYRTDFRDVYATVLHGHLKVDPVPILGARERLADLLA